jgi:hypothetical protein
LTLHGDEKQEPRRSSVSGGNRTGRVSSSGGSGLSSFFEVQPISMEELQQLVDIEESFGYKVEKAMLNDE